MGQTMTVERSPAGATASADEIARFDSLAGEWWDPDGQFRALHRMNPLRAGYVRDHACRYFARAGDNPQPFIGLKALDIGCGGGLLAESLADFGFAVTAIDAAADAVRVAQAHAASRGLVIDYRCASPEQLTGLDHSFDLITAMEVIEHVADLPAFFLALTRLLRPGGAVAIATLNRTWRSLALGKIAAEYILRWVPPGTHNWRQFVKPSEVATLLRRHALELQDASGMTLDPVAGSWSLTKDLSINFITFATAPSASMP